MYLVYNKGWLGTNQEGPERRQQPSQWWEWGMRNWICSISDISRLESWTTVSQHTCSMIPRQRGPAKRRDNCRASALTPQPWSEDSSEAQWWWLYKPGQCSLQVYHINSGMLAPTGLSSWLDSCNTVHRVPGGCWIRNWRDMSDQGVSFFTFPFKASSCWVWCPCSKNTIPKKLVGELGSGGARL